MRKLLAAALAGFAALAVPSSAAPIGLPARVVAIQPEIAYASYPTFAPDMSRRDDARWRIVTRTGNTNENYLGITSKGRLLDHGGTYLNFSDDAGQTWSSVRPTELLLGNEGAVTAAPGGDVVGIAWDAFFGDHIVSFKYDAASESWFHSEVPLHTPFFDRPWIAVVPGPFTVAGQTAPYISILRGGWPSKDTWFYSLDGLNYMPGSRVLETMTGSVDELNLRPDPDTDWIQPLASTAFTPLSGGGVLASQGITLTGALSIMQPPDLRWMDFDFPGQRAVMDDAWLTDSAGRVHRVGFAGDRKSFFYELSVDGGRTWRSTEAKLPQGFTASEWDFKASAQRGFAVVAIHAHDGSSPNDQDMVFVVAVDTPRPEVREILYVGTGKGPSRGNLVGGGPRYDFANVAIFPDGRIAASFKDSEVHPASTIAVLLDPIGLPRTEFDTTVPVISDFADRPDPFTPNGDGRKDVSKVTFDLSESANVYLDVYKGERLIRTLVDYVLPAGRHELLWDGTDIAGDPVPRGRYQYNLWAVDAAGNESDEFNWQVRVR